MDWLSHDRLGFNYRMSDVTAAIGVAQVERARRSCWPSARAWRRSTGERLASIEGLVLPCEDAGAERRSWFVYVVQLPERRGPRRRDRAPRRGRRRVEGLPPVIHLQPLYRERFGFRGGEFPVAEAVAARSLALPFFTAMGESEVERVAGALETALRTVISITCQPAASASSASPGWSPRLPSR